MAAAVPAPFTNDLRVRTCAIVFASTGRAAHAERVLEHHADQELFEIEPFLLECLLQMNDGAGVGGRLLKPACVAVGLRRPATFARRTVGKELRELARPQE